MQVIKQSKTRNTHEASSLSFSVSQIIEDVRDHGDIALRKYTEKFDQSNRKSFRVSQDEIKEAYSNVSYQEIESIKKAAENIKAFAEAQKATIGELKDFSPQPGILLGHRAIAVDSCCCYVPGGNYPLYSTALMLGIPANVAGVKRVVACTPPMKGRGKINPKTIVAMDIAGIDEIYAVGGAQAIAAFSYGTKEIAPVSLIVGPGNSFVTEAKRQCFGQVGIDFIAGPSEVLILADKTADPEILAADILAQSEHDAQAKGILVTLDEKLGHDTIAAVEEQLKTLSTEAVARKSWENFGEVLLMDNPEEAIEYCNKTAPEHLEVVVEDEGVFLPHLNNFGSLFIGTYAAEVFGDYASGTNHTLPTLGAARYTGGVWVGTFTKICTYQRMTGEGMKTLVPLVSELAKGEGLMAHARAAEIREEKYK